MFCANRFCMLMFCPTLPLVDRLGFWGDSVLHHVAWLVSLTMPFVWLLDDCGVSMVGTLLVNSGQ